MQQPKHQIRLRFRQTTSALTNRLESLYLSPAFLGVLLGLKVPLAEVDLTITGNAFNTCLFPSK